MVCRPVQREEEKKTPVKIDALKKIIVSLFQRRNKS